MSLPFPSADNTVTTLFEQSTIAPMQTFVWEKNSDGVYDIFNAYTPAGNEGNLQVIKSKIVILLSTFQGEWAPDPNFGLPLNAISTFQTDPNVVSQLIVDQILTVENVNNVTVVSFSFDASSRVFTASYNVNTAYGAVQVSI